MQLGLAHPGWERRVFDVAVYDLIHCVLFLPVHFSARAFNNPVRAAVRGKPRIKSEV